MKHFLSFIIALYPQRIRREHGEEMQQLLRDMERDGQGLSLGTVCRMSWDAICALPASHLHELSAGPRLVTSQGLLEAGMVTGKWMAAIAAMVGILIVFAFSMIEVYVPFAPYIDTKFAPGFSWEGYEQIRSGMTQEQVASLIGNPPDTSWVSTGHFLVEGQILVAGCWTYTEDGAFPYWDFAWIALDVCFDEHGKMVGKGHAILYD